MINAKKQNAKFFTLHSRNWYAKNGHVLVSSPLSRYTIQIIFSVIIVVVTFKIQLFQTPRSHYHMLHPKRKIFSLVIGNSWTISRNNVKKKISSVCPVLHCACSFFFYKHLCADVFPQGLVLHFQFSDNKRLERVCRSSRLFHFHMCGWLDYSVRHYSVY